MMKLNELLAGYEVEIFGTFPALLGLAERSNSCAERSAVISTIPAAQMLDKGIAEYYTIIMPRDSRFNTTQEIVDANLDVNLVHVSYADDIPADTHVVIASRHAATTALLQTMWPDNEVYESVTPNLISGKCVVGILPPALISHCDRFVAASIDNYNATIDGDLSADQLKDRLVINKAIKVEIVE